MKNRIIKAPLMSTGLLMMGLSTSLYSNNTIANEYCSSPKLYATNIRESCNQFGMNGMEALYQSSEFINSLIPLEQANTVKPLPTEKVGAQKPS